MSFIKAIKDMFTMVNPVTERQKELMRPIPIPSPLHMSQLPSQYHKQVADLQQRNHDLQNQLAATQANQQMMKAMLQQQQMQPSPSHLQQAYAQAARPQAWGGGAGGAYEMKYKPAEPETDKNAKMLEKLLEAKI